MIIRPGSLPPKPVDIGLLGRWPFDNASALDASGNPKVNGSLVAGPIPVGGIAQPVNGQLRGAFKCNGSSSYISIPGDASITSATAITLCGWINATNFTSGYSGIISVNNSINFASLFVKSTGKLACYVTGISAVSYDGTGSNTLSAGQWYHLALTYNSSAGLVGYVNGGVDGSAAANGNLTLSGGTTTFIGNDFTAGRFFAGIIDDVRIYNRALTAAEIFALSRMPFTPRVDIESIALMKGSGAVATQSRKILSPPMLGM